ncbi:hypothetical protein QYF36_002820 [Acer negundo]|nr:hypothetical protein QYF36_002820 [Acer negundo]
METRVLLVSQPLKVAFIGGSTLALPTPILLMSQILLPPATEGKGIIFFFLKDPRSSRYKDIRNQGEVGIARDYDGDQNQGRIRSDIEREERIHPEPQPKPLRKAKKGVDGGCESSWTGTKLEGSKSISLKAKLKMAKAKIKKWAVLYSKDLNSTKMIEEKIATLDRVASVDG